MNLLVSILIFLTYSAFAAPGFSVPEVSSNQSILNIANSSVFRIEVFTKKPWIVSKEKYQKVLSYSISEGGLNGLRLREEISPCIQKNTDTCDIYFLGGATAFSARNADEIWTVRHNFDKLIIEFLESINTENLSETEIHNKVLSDFQPDFRLLDRYNKIIFDTRTKSDNSVWVFLGNPKLSKHDMMPNKNSDFAVLKLSKKIGNPIPLSEEVPKDGENTFLIGFPAKTSGRPNINSYGNSNGWELLLSYGKTISPGQSFSINLDRDNMPEHIESEFRSMFLYSDGDGAPGNSGGPYLNSSGELIGIFSTQYGPLNNRNEPILGYSEGGGFGINTKFALSLLP